MIDESTIATIRRRLDPERLTSALKLREGAQRQKDGWLVRCQSPSHRDSTPSLSVTKGPDGTTRYRCFGCGISGDAFALVALVKNLDVAREFAMVAYEAGTLVNIDVPYPSSRAASAPVPQLAKPYKPPPVVSPVATLGHLEASVRAAGLYEQAALDGWHNLDGWLAIPWRDSQGAVTTIQRRYASPEGDVRAAPPEGTTRYRFPSGGGPREPYGVHRSEAADRRCELWLVEGAIDAAAVYALVALCGVRRVAALGLPGVASWSQLKAGVLTLARDRVVVVATDNDKAGDDAAKLIAADLAPVARLVRRERPGGKDWAEMLEQQIATRGAA